MAKLYIENNYYIKLLGLHDERKFIDRKDYNNMIAKYNHCYKLWALFNECLKLTLSSDQYDKIHDIYKRPSYGLHLYDVLYKLDRQADKLICKYYYKEFSAEILSKKLFKIEQKVKDLFFNKIDSIFIYDYQDSSCRRLRIDIVGTDRQWIKNIMDANDYCNNTVMLAPIFE